MIQPTVDTDEECEVAPRIGGLLLSSGNARRSRPQLFLGGLMAKLTRFLVAIVSCLATSAGLASAQDIELSWIPPAGQLVAGYNVYIAPSVSGPLVATPIDVGRPQVDAQGVARAHIAGIAPATLAIEMTSYDSSRRESARSNRVTLSRPSEYLAPPVFLTGFQTLAVGSHPASFADKGAIFSIADYPAGNRVLAAPATDGVLVSRYNGVGAAEWEPYELSGRIFFLAGSRRGGVAARVKLSTRASEGAFGAGFVLGSDSTGVFTLQPGVATPLDCANSNSTGVYAYASRWYRFRLRYTEPNSRSRVRAKVWMDGTTEPTAWQADCWTETLPATDSGIFALYRDGWGGVYWDDLSVRPVRGWWDRIPYL